MGISTVRGVALYVGALLGPGLLVLPGLAAAQADRRRSSPGSVC
jgi:hypothetical protein